MTEPTTELNVDLLLRVADHIEAHPETHTQRAWIYYLEEFRIEPGVWSGYSNDALGHPEYDPANVECNTRGCIAGWAVLLTPIAERPDLSVAKAAEQLLGMTPLEAVHFFHERWVPADDQSVSEALRAFANTRQLQGYIEEDEGDL
jgi:hypothetical protein